MRVGRIDIMNSGMPVDLQFSEFMKLDNRTRAFSGFTTEFNYLFTKTQLIIIYDSKKFFIFTVLYSLSSNENIFPY